MLTQFLCIIICSVKKIFKYIVLSRDILELLLFTAYFDNNIVLLRKSTEILLYTKCNISWFCKKLSTETHSNHFNWQLEWHKTGQRTHVLPLRLRIDDTNFKISFTLTNIMISNLQWKCQRQPWMAKVVEYKVLDIDDKTHQNNKILV